MHILVTDEVRISDVDDLTAFSVVSALTLDVIDTRLSASGLGSARDEHCWIDVPELRALGLAVTNSPTWNSDFDRMIEYARGKGWYDEEADTVRAHVTPPTPRHSRRS